MKRFSKWLVLGVALAAILLSGCQLWPTPTPPPPTPTATATIPPSATIPPTATEPAGRDVLWSVDFETGDFSELTARYPGGGLDMGVVWRSGDASATVTDTQAYSGRYSVLLASNGSNQSSAGIRVGFRATPRSTYLPTPGYYGVKLYIPTCQQIGTFWNLFQYKNVRPISGGQWTSDPTVSVNVENFGDGCNMRLILNQKLDEDGNTNKRNVATAPVTLPIGQWFDLTCRFVWSEDADVGQITCWQDGTLIFDEHMRTATNTGYDYEYPLQWLVNAYGDRTYRVYMDDPTVWVGRK